MKRKLLAAIVLVTGCAAHSGIVPIGPDTFMVSRQAATGFPGMGNLKAEVFQEANDFCVSRNKAMQVVRTDEAKPPFVLGNYPRIEVQFMCLDANDPELQRPKLRKEPDTVIEIQNDKPRL